MARVNVEQKALSDSRFARLGLLLVNSEYPEISMDTAQAIGLGRMVKLWNECQERCVYVLSDHDLVVLLGHRNGAQILIESGLGEREKRGSVRIKGTRGRVEWLQNKRDANRENGKHGGRPRKTQPEPTGNHSGFPQETTPAPAPALTEKPQTKNARSAESMIEEFAITEPLRQWASEHVPTLDVDAQTRRWRDRLRANGYRTKEGPVKDAAASWRYWMETAAEISARKTNARHDNRKPERKHPVTLV